MDKLMRLFNHHRHFLKPLVKIGNVTGVRERTDKVVSAAVNFAQAVSVQKSSGKSR
jgi:hypothetical protein